MASEKEDFILSGPFLLTSIVWWDLQPLPIYIYLKKKKKKRIDNKKQSLVSKFTYLFGLWPLRFFERWYVGCACDWSMVYFEGSFQAL